jgi:hypothetical protein
MKERAKGRTSHGALRRPPPRTCGALRGRPPADIPISSRGCSCRRRSSWPCCQPRRRKARRWTPRRRCCLRSASLQAASKRMGEREDRQFGLGVSFFVFFIEFWG